MPPSRRSARAAAVLREDLSQCCRRSLLAAALALALAAGPAALAGAAADPASGPPPPADGRRAPLAAAAIRCVARVNGAELHRSDLEAAQQTLPPQVQQQPLGAALPALLDRMIDAHAGRRGRAQGEARPTIREVAAPPEADRGPADPAGLFRAIAEAAQRPRTSSRRATTKYVKNKPAREEVHARHILVPTEDEAKAIIDQLNKGADFANARQENSTDPAGKASGGDLGYFTRTTWCRNSPTPPSR